MIVKTTNQINCGVSSRHGVDSFAESFGDSSFVKVVVWKAVFYVKSSLNVTIWRGLEHLSHV